MQPGGSFNGLTWGPGQTLHFAAQKGLTSSPPRRISDVDRLGAHGAFYGRDVYSSRVITIELVWNQDQLGADFAAVRDLIDSAMQIVQADALPLYVDGGTKLLWVRPVDQDVDRDFGYRSSYGHATLQFRAADPLIYDAMETVVAVPMALTQGGWTFPWVFPWTFIPPGAPPVVQAAAFNAGTIDIAPSFRIQGPVDVGVEIRNMTTQAALSIALPLLATDWIDVDMATERVLFQSAYDRRGNVVHGTDFWTMPPGVNTVKLSSLGAVVSTTSVMRYRSAYTAL